MFSGKIGDHPKKQTTTHVIVFGLGLSSQTWKLVSLTQDKLPLCLYEISIKKVEFAGFARKNISKDFLFLELFQKLPYLFALVAVEIRSFSMHACARSEKS